MAWRAYTKNTKRATVADIIFWKAAGDKRHYKIKKKGRNWIGYINF